MCGPPLCVLHTRCSVFCWPAVDRSSYAVSGANCSPCCRLAYCLSAVCLLFCHLLVVPCTQGTTISANAPTHKKQQAKCIQICTMGVCPLISMCSAPDKKSTCARRLSSQSQDIQTLPNALDAANTRYISVTDNTPADIQKTPWYAELNSNVGSFLAASAQAGSIYVCPASCVDLRTAAGVCIVHQYRWFADSGPRKLL